MQHSNDLAPRHLRDFVSALSAEQGCDVCHELSASVFELRCTTCEAAICPECARTSDAAAMFCMPCFERAAQRDAAARAAATPLRDMVVRKTRQSAVALTLAGGQALVVSRRALALAFVVSAHSRRLGMLGARHGARKLRQGGRYLRPHAKRLAANTQRTSRALGQRARRGLAQSQVMASRGLSHTREATQRGWRALRSIPVREHTRAAVLTVALLYSVARADYRA